MKGERVGWEPEGTYFLLQHTVLSYNMDEQPPLKEMRNIIDYCRGRRKQLIIGCDTSECYILWAALALIQKWKTD
jgi:hypothetical protein